MTARARTSTRSCPNRADARARTRTLDTTAATAYASSVAARARTSKLDTATAYASSVAARARTSKLDTTTAVPSLTAGRLRVTNSVGDLVERSWMISVEESPSPVTHPVASPVEQTWTFFGLQLVHSFGVCHPPITVDVRPTCCARENSMTPGGWRLTHTVHRDY